VQNEYPQKIDNAADGLKPPLGLCKKQGPL
jgi:hypothetical protein